MAKLKSGNVIVRILLAHGEKIGMLAILICAGMLFWSAMGREHLGEDREPQDLKQLAESASKHIQGFEWNSLDPNDKLMATPVSSESMAPIAAEHFPPLPHPFDRPVLDPVRQRLDPELLALEDLEVHGDSGLWTSADPEVIKRKQLEAFKEAQKLQQEREEEARKREAADPDRRDRRDAGGRGLFGEGSGEYYGRGRAETRDRESKRNRREGPVVVSPRSQMKLQGYEDITARSWVTIVAKVPVEEQYQLYEDALASSTAYDSSRDVPSYKGYQVERAEVTSEGTGEWKRIASVNADGLMKKAETYPFPSAELISRRYTHLLLTHPLPPLILRDWDRRVTHSSIPLITEEQPEEIIEEPAEPQDEEADDEESIFASDDDEETMGGRFERDARLARGGRGMPAGAYGGRGGLPGFGGYGEGGYGGPGVFGGEGVYGRGGYGEGGYGEGGYGGYGSEMMGGRMGGMRRGGSQAMYVWDGETSHVLFRYFDDTVEPGRRYRYRVRLAVADVNHGVPEQYLDKAVVERRNKIENKKLKVFRFTAWSERSPVASVPLPARVYVAGADPPSETAVDGELEANILVKVFNSELPAELAKVETFVRGSVLNLAEKADVVWSERATAEDQEQLKEEFLFRTGITVVDMRGGERLSRKNRDLTNPAQALLMDPAGRLFLQAELDDSEAVTEFQETMEGGADARGRFDGGFGGYGPGGYGGYGEGVYGPGF